MPNMNTVAYKTRLANEYAHTMKLNEASGGMISVRPAPGENIPYVKKYHVTYNIPTYISGGLLPKKQDRTVVEVSVTALNTAPRAKVVAGLSQVPFHPNWYNHGSVCNGTGWEGKEMWLSDYICFVGELLQFKASRINPNSPANHAANDWWKANRNNRRLFPTDSRPMPNIDESKPKPALQLKIVKVTPR